MTAQTILINEFLAKRVIAIAGVSRNTNKFGYKVFEKLKSNGFSVYPIHHEATEFDGVKCYKSANDVPSHVQHLLILTPAMATDKVIRDAVLRGYDMVWFQLHTDTPSAIELASKNNMKVILNYCIFMFVNPQGSHKFHRFIMRLRGKV